MNSDLVALLALQTDDEGLHELETRVAAFAPRLEALDKGLRVATAEVEKARSALLTGEKDEHELQAKLEEQKQLHERSVSQLDSVRKPREAAAAMTQAEITKRFLKDMETEVQQAVSKVVDARQALKDRERELADLEERQRAERTEIEKDLEVLGAEVAAARGKREELAKAVPKALLQKYDRIRGRRRVRAIFALQNVSCGNCDTALPIQRRNVMVSAGIIETCEACGVLLYAGE